MGAGQVQKKKEAKEHCQKQQEWTVFHLFVFTAQKKTRDLVDKSRKDHFFTFYLF